MLAYVKYYIAKNTTRNTINKILENTISAARFAVRGKRDPRRSCSRALYWRGGSFNGSAAKKSPVAKGLRWLLLDIAVRVLTLALKSTQRIQDMAAILDDKDMHRRFRMSNFQSTTRVRPFCTSMPIGLSGGWNQIQFNLADFTRRAYGTNYVETTRIQIHANCRVRRIYFADRLYSEDELPEDFKLFKPLQRVKCVREKDVAKEKIEEPEKIETEEPPSFEAGEVAEEAEEEPEEEPTEDELAEEEIAPVEDARRPDETGDEDEEEEDEDEVEPADVGDYVDEDEGDEPVPAPTTPGYATEEETDVEQDEGDEDEEYGVP